MKKIPTPSDPIASAISARRFEEVAQLAAAGVPLDDAVDGRDGYFYSPLTYAIAIRDPDAVRVLLDTGADPNALDPMNRPPLLAALVSVTGDQVDLFEGIARTLVARGARVSDVELEEAKLSTNSSMQPMHTPEFLAFLEAEHARHHPGTHPVAG